MTAPTRAWAPFAVKRKMPYNDRLPKRNNSQTLILHTNGGGTDKGSLYGWFARPNNDIASHFQIAKDGTIEQYVGIDREAYAQYSGNAYGISVETEDDGKPSTLWTDAQIAAIIKLARWLDIPARVSPDHAGGGIGWHSLYTDWNQSHHDCPGSVRVAQIHSTILPGLKKPRPHPHPLTAHKQADAADLTGELAKRHKPLPHGKGSGRGKLRRLAAQIRRLLGRKK